MNKDYGIKIAKQGTSVNSTDIRDLQFSSKYSMLKYHKDMIGTITLVPGDTEKTVDFEHQLGYVPAFMSYGKSLWNNAYYFIPGIAFPSGFENPGDGYAYSNADSVKVRCGVQIVIGKYNTIQSDISDRWFTVLGGGNSFLLVGNYDGESGSGAVRITGVTIAQGTTITQALLNVYCQAVGAGNINLKTYGIDEDNTASFSSSPMGRTKTSAVTTTTNLTLPSAGNFFAIDITAQVQEIVNRGGWSSGNAMGFIIDDNSTASGVYAEDDIGGSDESNIEIKYGSNTTLTFRVIIFKNRIA